MSFGQRRYADENELLDAKFAERGVLICAHRGSWHGNVVQNTTIAFKAALMQGADILETDATASVDGEVFALHDGYEERMFGWRHSALDMSADQIAGFLPTNALGEPSSHRVQRLEEVLAYLCHEELLNIDRTWRAKGLVLDILDRHPHMRRQAILKAPLAHRAVFDQLAEHPIKYMAMPICRSLADVDEALSYRDLNVVGVEMIAPTPQDELFSDEAIAYVHGKGLFCWANALTLTDVFPRAALYGGLDDDTSIWHGPEAGWGRLIDKGIDVIQTDWPALLRDFRARWPGARRGSKAR